MCLCKRQKTVQAYSNIKNTAEFEFIQFIE